MKKTTALAVCALAFVLSGCSTTEQQVEELLEQMAANPIGSPTWQQAVDQLAAIGRPAARQLLAHLNPDHYRGEHYREYRAEREKIRTGAARALGRIKPRGATAALDDRITSAYTDSERVACIWAVGEVGDAVGVDPLKAQLEDADALIRLHAALALVKLDDTSGRAEIENALAGDSESLAQIALHGLEEANYAGVPLLASLLEQESPRQQPLRQLVGRVEQNLIAQLQAEDPVERQRSARALGRIGGPQARQALVSCLQDANNLVRFNAAASLAGMDHQEGVDFLFSALRNEDPILRANAVKFLTQVQRRTGAVESQLITALQDQAPLARAGAAQVLGQARVDAAVEPLIGAVQDPVAEVRTTAVIALGHIGAPRALLQLQILARDADQTVSYYAEWALKKLGQS